MINRPFVVSLWFAALSGLAVSAVAPASQLLIEEAEKLRNSLPRKEKQQRRTFTIRLANLYYSEAIKLSVDKPDDVKAQEKVKKYRQRALSFYKEYLSGDNGEYEKASGEQKAAAEFNMARLYADNGDVESARKLWESLAKEGEEYPKIASESALSLAELLEAKDPASKAAFEYYGKALAGEAKHDTRIYIHYRRAWIQRNQEKITPAIAELKEAMYDSKGQLKDEVVSDLIVFHTMSDINPKDAIEYFESLGDRIQQDDLVKRLGDAYLAAGKKDAAITVLANANGKKADLLTQAKLLEETYGMRNWEMYEETLEGIKFPDTKSLDDKAQKKVNAILKRLIVQLDSERKTTPDTLPHYITTANLFLRFYPQDETSFKVVSSLAGAHKEPEARITFIKETLASPTFKLNAEQKLSLKEQLVGLYQKLGQHDAAAGEAKSLAAVTGKKEDKRRFMFVEASELFDGGKVEAALPLFAKIAQENGMDDMGRKSLMIVVREKGKAKDYQGAVKMAKPWLAQADKSEDVKKSTEYKAVQEVYQSSEFEWATSIGDKPEALAVFNRYCNAKQFVPQSCNNAKGIAARIKDYDSLMALLKAENAADELATIYEENGFFADAAKYYDGKILSKADAATTDFLKVSLFYEIAGDLESRQKVLNKLANKLKKASFASEQEEALVLQTFKDAGMMTAAILPLPWSEGNKCTMMDQLVMQGGNDGLKKSILACKEATGPAWSQIVLSEVNGLAAAQEKIKFHGKNSEANFKRRLNAIKKLDASITKYLKVADQETYQTLVTKGQQAYEKLSADIMATPIPKETPTEQLPQIQQALTEMAAPFQEKASAYAGLVAKQTQETTVAEKTEAPASEKQPEKVPQDQVQALVKVLNKDPENREAIRRLYELYKSKEQKRIAAYFEGRLNRLEGSL